MREVNTVAILSPGEMGSAVGRALRSHGKDVVTCLEGRSRRTRELARASGFRDLPMDALVRQAGLVLSIVVPGEAAAVARRIADAMRSAGVGKPYADCNAVSPQTGQAMCEAIVEAGGTYIDASIIGGPPSESEAPRFYVSGRDTSAMEALDGLGIRVRPMGEGIGRAKAIKMCYAGTTKGTTALYTAVLTAAELLGVSAELRAELADSQADALRQMQGVRRTPAVARRWVAEMEEIAATFESVGVTPRLHEGAAEVYRMVSASPIGQETPETLDPRRTLDEVIKVLADSVVERRPEKQA